MPRHADMDFPHMPAWCDDCNKQELQGQMLQELRRQNDLKETELRMRSDGDWVEERPRQRREYVPPPEPKKPEVKGGMNIEPRRS